MSDVIIKIEDLSKQYRLGTVGTGTLSHDINRWWASLRGKEDPFLKIGEVNDRTKASDAEYVWALKDINVEIERGDIVGIIGKNGAGKSTLLKILSKVTRPTIGNIKLGGRIASLLEVGTGFHPEMTGRENIYLNGAILGMRKAEITQKFDEIVAFAGVERYVDTPVKRYSSGMYVRLAFSVAAHLEPEILIVDEVLAVGDAQFQKKCLGRMEQVGQEGRTIIFVSHNLAAVKNLCNKGILLQQGIKIFEGSAKDVIAKYNEFDSIVSDFKNVIANQPNDELFEYLDLNILQNGHKVTEVLGDLAFDIEVTYRLRREEEKFRLFVDLCDEAGELIGRSFFDSMSDEPAHLKAGVYKSTLKIQEKSLGPLAYTLFIQAGIHNQRRCSFENGLKIPLRVSYENNIFGPFLDVNFTGKILIPGAWRTDVLS